MTISDMDFFHQATLRICSSLDIEKVIEACFDYLKDFVPLDRILLNILDEDAYSIKNITMFPTTSLSGKIIRMGIPKEMKQIIDDTSERIIIEPHAEKHPIGQTLKKYMNHDRYSGLVVRLVIDEKVLGVMILVAYGNNRFNAEHARLASLLNDPLSLALANTIKHQEILKLKEILTDDNQYLKKEISQMRGDEIIGANYGLQEVMEMVRQVAPLSSNVLILGETGTGKEVIANAIHFTSPRGDLPFIKVNCGAIPENLIDSELFGHEKGAFTGAISQKRGRFERAHQGTIFLDEIGELPLAAQVRLLRVIQTGEIERVGGEQPIPVDIRIIAATHRNLEQMVREGKFREDLWFRLNVFPITVPPLRHRKFDIPALVEYFCERKSRELNIQHDPAKVLRIVEHLKDYHWPGNIRELENLVERALIRNRSKKPGTELSIDRFLIDFDKDRLEKKSRDPVKIDNSDSLPLNLDEANRRIIQSALNLTNGKVQGETGAAKMLGINPNTLRNRMKKLGIAYGRNSSK